MNLGNLSNPSNNKNRRVKMMRRSTIVINHPMKMRARRKLRMRRSRRAGWKSYRHHLRVRLTYWRVSGTLERNCKKNRIISRNKNKSCWLVLAVLIKIQPKLKAIMWWTYWLILTSRVSHNHQLIIMWTTKCPWWMG